MCWGFLKNIIYVRLKLRLFIKLGPKALFSLVFHGGKIYDDPLFASIDRRFGENEMKTF